MTQLLVELLQIKDRVMIFEDADADLYALFESLGSLNLINKKLLRLFKKNAPWQNKDAPLRDQLGQNSKIDTHPETHQNTMFDRFNDDPKAVAMVVKYGEEQVLCIVKDGRGKSGTPIYSLIAEPTLFSKIIPEADYVKLMGNIGRRYRDDDFSIDRLLGGVSRASLIGKFRKLLKVILDMAKKDKVTVRSMIVLADEERARKSAERVAARSGAVPPNRRDETHKKYNDPTKRGNHPPIASGRGGNYVNVDKMRSDWKNSLQRDVRERLSKFKAENAKGADSPEDLLKLIIKDGYMDKIKFSGFTYELSNERLYLRELKDKAAGKKSSFGVPSIEYTYDKSGPEADALAKKVRELRKMYDFGDNKDQEKYEQERQKILPPRTLRVNLALKGGMIVPDSIETSEDRAWMF